MKINKLIIDSTNSVTDLCNLGAKYGTDKSPYNTEPGLHKHSYTAVYDLLFSAMRPCAANVAEIGILNNKSMKCWRDYFEYATLIGFEYSHALLDNGKKDNLEDSEYIFMDIKSDESINKALEQAGCNYDIVIEDSTHEFEDQIRFINHIHKWMISGAILVIEDIFRSANEDDYRKALSHLEDYYSGATFIETNHANNFSPGWNNDKLLILFKK
jgi:hypothetical protein